jgi:hypothetical protein
MIIFILILIGIVGIVVGIWSIIYLRQFKESEYAPQNWKKLRARVLLIAILLGLLTWPGTYYMGYPFAGEVEKDKGRIVGIPFFVTYFDSEGRDFLGPFTRISVTLNGLFWFFVPNILLFAYAKKRKKRLTIGLTIGPRRSRSR